MKKTVFFLCLTFLVLAGCAALRESERITVPATPVPRPAIKFADWATGSANVTFQYFKGFNVATHRLEQSQINAKIAELKALSANILAIEIIFLTRGKNIEANLGGQDPEVNLSLMITEAHRQGLLTELRIVAVFPTMHTAVTADYTEWLANTRTMVATWARFAERYHVYQMSYGEIDINHCNFTDSSLYLRQLPEVVAAYATEAKNYFTGKVGATLGPPYWSYPYSVPTYNFNGLDYLGISVYTPPETPFTTFAGQINDLFANIAPLLSHSNIDTLLVGETDIVVLQEYTHDAFGNPVTSESRAAYFETFFNTARNQVKGFYIVGMNDDPRWNGARTVIRNWYNTL